MAHNLDQAARDDNIEALYEEIARNPQVLDTIDDIPFTDTPFHVAAAEGKIHFALEIMMLKPSLARKLDKNGYSPMHLAVLNGHDEVVRGLLLKDSDLIRVNGKEGRTPLHCMAAVGGNPSLLYEMLFVCPGSIQDLTAKRETPLHLAVKENQAEAFEALVEFINRFHKEEIFRWQDEDGYTFLHLATKASQLEMIKLLFKRYHSKEWNLGVEVDDGKGQTAIDMAEDCEEHSNSIKTILVTGSFEAAANPKIAGGASFKAKYWTYIMHILSVAVGEMPSDSRDALLVVLTLVNTTSFQVGLNPPGGFWQDNGTVNDKTHFAGTPILSTTSPGLYQIISYFTMAGFFTSLNLIFVLTMRMPMKFLLLIALGFLSSSYLVAYIAITRKLGAGVILGTYLVVFVMANILSVVYVWRFLLPNIEHKLLGKHLILRKDSSVQT